jgi:hypothetical protein
MFNAAHRKTAFVHFLQRRLVKRRTLYTKNVSALTRRRYKSVN